ncbi:hypothetical protein SAMN05421736_12746 [Evansella caseinilytica]|uniref:Uncharacterized protein n=1 Tax=Evansella caseinilytica TaxID=1503961 RepID=A0A1H3UVT1_9BACI|nr:hypothetical protein SAMN05421736_12746 [Evansella caseinilytica]
MTSIDRKTWLNVSEIRTILNGSTMFRSCIYSPCREVLLPFFQDILDNDKVRLLELYVDKVVKVAYNLESEGGVQP